VYICSEPSGCAQLDRYPARQRVYFGIARTFQHVQLRLQMSVIENVALGAHIRGRRGMLTAPFDLKGWEESSLLNEAKRQLERVGLAAAALIPAGNLALGQQRIVEIARALAADLVLLA
jgi:branched-chain amino acid transport system permease protein